MAVIKETHLYEILVRFDALGFQGAHVRDLEVVKDEETGEVYAAKEGDARPVALKEVGPLIGKQSGKLLDAAAAEKKRADAAEAELSKIEAEAASAAERASHAESRLAAIQAALAQS